MSSSGPAPTNKTTTTSRSQLTGSASQSQKKRTRLVSEKKIADDEFMAAAIGDVEWLRQSLRDQGGEINFDKNGLCAIHLAAIHGRLNCLKLCIEKAKININLASSTGWRPVHLCISNQTGKRAVQCLSYLLQKGADPSIANDDGITPMHQAASEGHVECLKLLIEIGAKVDGRDCRGNTPLDLAKLWGHKKCARILAAEMWHQEKDHVAKEMRQLKKMKMQQVLEEMEKEEEFRAAQQFHGDIAFKNWLKEHSLEERPTGPRERGEEEQEAVKTAARPKGGMKPNSQGSQGSQGSKGSKVTSTSTRSGSTTDKTPKSTPLSSTRTQPPPAMPGKTANLSLILEGTDADLAELKQEEAKKPRPNTRGPPYVNPTEWRKYSHLPSSQYTPILGDDYPRDPFTFMHRVRGANKYYTGKHAHHTCILPEELEEVKGAELRPPDLPREMIKKGMKKDPSLDERPVVFKPTHISDVDHKHLPPPEKKPASEVSLHMTDDMSSKLFKLSLTAGLASTLKTPDVAYDEPWIQDSRMSTALAVALRQMGGPRLFPKIIASEYQGKYGGKRLGV